MLLRNGTVVELRGNRARVEFEGLAACGGCQTGQGCGIGPLLTLFRPASRRFFWLDLPAEHERGMKIGDAVRISLPARDLLRGTGLAYALPLGATLAFAWLAVALFPQSGDPGAVAGALTGLMIGRILLASAGRPARIALLP